MTKGQLHGRLSYADNLSVYRTMRTDDGQNVGRSLEVEKKYGIAFNEPRSKIRIRWFSFLGFEVPKNAIAPDLERLKLPKELLASQNMKTQKCLIGISA